MTKTRKMFLVILFSLLFTTGCAPHVIDDPLVSDKQSETSAESTALVTDADINYAYHFAEKTLSSEQWERELRTESERIMVTWTNYDLGSVVFLDYRIYPDGYTDEILDSYYSDANFSEVLFSNYYDLSAITKCQKKTLRLYELSARFEDSDYLIRKWVDLENENRMTDFTLVFLAGTQDEFERYAEAIFPSLPSCQ